MTRRRRRASLSETTVSRNGAQPVQVMEAYHDSDSENTALRERLAALEMALESVDWRLLSMSADQEFTRQGLRDITEFSRIMFLKNPLIRRGVETKRLYVLGQGYNVKAADMEIDAALTAFYSDPDNRIELTSHQAHGMKETELQTDGNLFFVLFTNTQTGRVKLRSMPFDEVDDLVTDPEDAKRAWYYLRRWTQVDADGTQRPMAAYYPDWRYQPLAQPSTFRDLPVRWEQPVFHVRVGGFSNWRWGISEVYAAIDWAKGYKEFLEDWASIVRAYRRFAFQLSTPGGRSGVAAAKARLSTTIGSGSGETNPPPLPGSTFIAGEGTTLTPVRTAGATVSADDGRRMLLMVAAATGLPETFFGDASVGTLATAKSLDRPTELMMRDRQTLWSDVLAQMHDYVLLQAVRAPRGALRGLGTVALSVEDGRRMEWVEWADDIDPHVAIDWPPLIEHDTAATIAAITQAATLNGQQLAGTMDVQMISRLVLSALGVQDVDQVLAGLFDDETGEPLGAVAASEAAWLEAVRELRATLAQLRG